IEAALEKVRATAMAMHESSELNKVIREVSEQLSLLGFVFDISNIGTDISPEGFYIWNASPSQSIISGVYVPYKELDFVNWFYSNKEKTDAPVSARFTKTQKNAFFRHYFTKTEGKNLSPERKKYVLDGQSLDISTVHKKEFTLNVFNYRGIVYSDEQNHILYRFANVFEQAYARFLDLKKAEAQAREAQIEAALERVRARTMGMHKSIELHDVIKVISEQIIALGVKFDHTTFIQFNHDKSIEVWVTTPEQPYPAQIHVPFINHRFFNVQSEMTKIKSDFLAEIYDKEEKNRFFNHFFKNTIASNIPKNRQNYVLQAPGMARHTFRVSTIYFSIANYECIPYTDEENKVLRRFANVFKQSYTRFLDLQKAEAQAREAKIEASLERVRAKAMAMHKSDEVQEVVHAMFEEMAELGVDMGSAVVTSELDEEYPEKGVNMWVATDEDIYFKKIYLPYFDHPVWDNIIHNLKKKKNFYTEVFNKKIKDDFFSYLYKHTDLKYAPEERKKMIFKSPGMSRANVVNKNAGLYVMKFKDQPFSDEENKIVQRFGKVFEQTFTRFLDLQRAEKQAREAVKQASLDRVRAEIASMRNAEDLNRITPVIWRELKTFEVPFIRCGVFIIDEKTEKVQVYLTTPEGAALAVLNLKIGENRITKDTVDFWRKRQVYKEHWNKEEFINWTKSMMKTGQVQSAEKYQGSALAPESLDLHFIPFKQGMLYVGNTNPLSDEELNLVDSLAKTFSIAYARYEDFKKLEEAKNKIELTLNELKAAQSQLIQSEKMASLGELTAGIAHEIQNPLNFVNNFSEINSELIEEQKKELENENSKEAKILANEIGENEKKIIHHGKRAESIVKGMLLHSRQSSGKKELVDVNMLADEYLRLAYHGFRAKDESFNADFKLEADESLPKIEVVPQDFGRVLLNLINNAFYAVNKRAKEPTPHPPEGGLRNSHTEYKP
ncbi:MAG TPA: hypothetical protein VKA10_01585, partial [Prolixibacteraceae bacterium]|nr:hypothetical protein [Prolixibacteraceae bacterium]